MLPDLTIRSIIINRRFPYGEIQIFKQIPNWITFEHYGNDSFVFSNKAAGEKDKYMAQQAFHRARKAMSSGKFDIVIMDEICVAIFFGLLKTQDVLSLLEEKLGSVELILTGRYCPPELIERADLVTEVQFLSGLEPKLCCLTFSNISFFCANLSKLLRIG